MTVIVNDKPMELPDDSSVSSVLQTVGISSCNGVAIAINNRILKKEEWDTHQIYADDRIVLIRASQGG